MNPLLLACHYFGNGIEDLVVAAAAAGGALGQLLYLLKFPLNIRENLRRVQRLFHVRIAYVLTFADNCIFHMYFLLWSGVCPLYP